MKKGLIFFIFLLVFITLALDQPKEGMFPESNRRNPMEGALTGRVIVQLQTQPTLNKKRVSGVSDAASLKAIQETEHQKILKEQEEFEKALMDRTRDLGSMKVFSVGTIDGLVPAKLTRIANTITIDIGDADMSDAIRRLSRLPHVKNVIPEQKYKLDMMYSRGKIKTGPTFPDFGNGRECGNGVKVAVLDTGIYSSNKLFIHNSDDDVPYPFVMPEGFPVGEKSGCNSKVIAGRFYYDPNLPPFPSYNSSFPLLGHNIHGTHCAGTVAGFERTLKTFGIPLDVHIGGVSPGAYLLNYRIFYNAVEEDITSSSFAGDSQVLLAFEQAIEDGVDVLSNSWGGPKYFKYKYDPLTNAIDDLKEKGLLVVASTGNSYYQMRSGWPPGALRVAAVYNDIGRVTCLFVPQNKSFTHFYGGIDINLLKEPVENLLVFPNNSLETTACEPLDGNYENMTVAVKFSSLCSQDQQAQNVFATNASFILFHGKTTADGFVPKSDEMSAYTLTSFITELFESGEPVYLGIYSPSLFGLEFFTIPGKVDYVAPFSSRGPTVSMDMGVEIAAPGFYILSSAGEGLQYLDGTSMAVPHISGVAADVKSRNPGFTGEDIKAAIMNTADFKSHLNDDDSPAQPTDIGAGVVNAKRARSPEVKIYPPSISFGLISNRKDNVISDSVSISNYLDESLKCTAKYVSHVGKDKVEESDNYIVSPKEFELLGKSDSKYSPKSISVTFNTEQVGDIQGYVVVTCNKKDETDNTKEFGVPVWSRVQFAQPKYDFCLLDFSRSTSPLSVYKETLDLGNYSYYIWTPEKEGITRHFDDITSFGGCKAVIEFSGPNSYYNRIDYNSLDHDIKAILHAGTPVIRLGKNILGLMGYAFNQESSIPDFSHWGTTYEFSSVIQNEKYASNESYAKGTKKSPAAFLDVEIPLNPGKYLKMFIRNYGLVSYPLLSFPEAGSVAVIGTTGNMKLNGDTYNDAKAVQSVFGLEDIADAESRLKFIQMISGYLLEEAPELDINVAHTCGNVVRVSFSRKDGENMEFEEVYWFDPGDPNGGENYQSASVPSFCATHEYKTPDKEYPPRIFIETPLGRFFSYSVPIDMENVTGVKEEGCIPKTCDSNSSSSSSSPSPSSSSLSSPSFILFILISFILLTINKFEL